MPTVDQKTQSYPNSRYGREGAVNPEMRGDSGWKARAYIHSPMCAGANGLPEPYQPTHQLR